MLWSRFLVILSVYLFVYCLCIQAVSRIGGIPVAEALTLQWPAT